MKTRFYYITAILSMLMMALTTKAQETEYEYVSVVREGVEWGMLFLIISLRVLNFERNVADGRIVYKSEEFDDRDPTCAGQSVAAVMQAPAITITVAGKTVTAASSGNGTITATIHDINGRTIATAQSANGSAEIDMAGFTPGIYIVTATTANDCITRKIIL